MDYRCWARVGRSRRVVWHTLQEQVAKRKKWRVRSVLGERGRDRLPCCWKAVFLCVCLKVCTEADEYVGRQAVSMSVYQWKWVLEIIFTLSMLFR